MLVTGFFVSSILARRSLRPLEEMLSAQSRFTSDAAHELRTPLTAMKTEIEVSLRDKKLSKDEAVEVLESNLEEVQKLETLTSALLRLAKSDEKVDKTLWNDYRLIDILEGAKDRVAKKANDKSIEILLPKSKVKVNGDADQLLELFVTLFDNALKYSAQKSKVEVKVEKLENKVYASVTDQGVGITEVDLPHIFERFYRADQSRSKTKVGGYGLGLSLAKTIAEAHGGKISVESEYKKGSTFTVELNA
jgi:signal transduction histidine kinase